MKKVKLKFRGKMLLWIISAVIVISGGVQYYTNADFSRVVLNSEKETINEKVQGIKICIESQLVMDQLIASVMSKNELLAQALTSGDKKMFAECNTYLTDVVQSNEKFEIVVVIDKDGLTVASSDPSAIGVNVKDREYFQSAVQGKGAITDALKSRASGNIIFGVSHPVMDGDKVIGVLFIGNKLSYLYENLIKPVKAGRTGYSYVMNKDGLILAHPVADIVFNKEFSALPATMKLSKMVYDVGEGEVRYWWEDIGGYKVAEVVMLSNGWRIVLSVPESELLEPLSHITYLSIFAALALIVGTSLVVFVLIGSVSKVLATLTNLMLNLAVGKVDNLEGNEAILSHALKRSDEFGEITQAAVEVQQYFVEVSKVAQSLANKDLNVKIDIRSKDDILGNSLSNMVVNFNDALGQFRAAVAQVNDGALQINSASQSLSSGATQQAAAIEEIANSVTNMDTQTQTNAETAVTANKYTVEANDAAVNGQKQMNSLSSAMENMSQRASEVQKIIKTIDDIAFQTNLLALNAAVEAARAGAHGKGFAVVAEEVRNLAARSAKAAGETAVLIENVVSEIKNGNSVAEVTAESLNKIADGISKTTELIGEIAAAASEQSVGMKQIGAGLKQIEQVTQSNTASSEQTASASEEMTGMSRQLNELISEFNIVSVKAKSGKMNNRDRKKVPQLNARKKMLPPAINADVVQPKDVIKLDDSEFGKF